MVTAISNTLNEKRECRRIMKREVLLGKKGGEAWLMESDLK